MDAILKFLFGTSMATVIFFSQPVVEMDGSSLIIKGELHGAVTEKVEKIINTGTQVSIIYHVSIEAVVHENKTLLKKRIVNRVKYNHLEGEYRLNLNGITMNTTDKRAAYFRISNVKAVFEIEDPANTRFMNCLMDADIDYDSSLKNTIQEMSIPEKYLWEYYNPVLKVKGEIRFQ